MPLRNPLFDEVTVRFKTGVSVEAAHRSERFTAMVVPKMFTK
jgi:hypothetical protein